MNAIVACLALLAGGDIPHGGQSNVYRSANAGGAFTSGVEHTSTGTCTGTDSVLADNNGYVGCQKLSDVAPQGLLVRPQPAYAGGTQTAASLVFAGGQDETKIAVDGSDPSVTCVGDNDTVTVTVVDSNGASTATILTEGTQWTASASVATTCSSLAAAVEALAGVGATCTSPNVLVTLDPSTAAVTLAESTAGCTTVSAGTPGNAVLAQGRLVVGSAANSPSWLSAGSSMQCQTVGTSSYCNVYGTFVGQGTRAQVVEGSGSFVAASGGQYAWSDSASSGGAGNLDTGLKRCSAGMVCATNGGAGNGNIGAAEIKDPGSDVSIRLAPSAGVISLVDDGNGTSANFRAGVSEIISNEFVAGDAVTDKFQFRAAGAGAPAGADCDNDSERGRLYIDTTNHRLYVCNGGTRLWDYATLTD